MFLLNWLYGARATLTDKIQHFGLSSVKQVEDITKSKIVDESVE